MTKKGKMTRMSVAIVTAIVMVLCAMSMLLAACGSASISLNKTDESMFVGDTLKITATVTGDDDAEVEWTSSDTAVATVRRGTVTAVGAGEAVITAALESGASATCKVKVSERTVTISQTTATINLDESNTLTLTAEASDGGDCTWTSSNPAVATVVGGVVTGLDIGTATITAQRGAATATCEVTVTEPSRPEDYYKITKLTNSEVVADPGVWHYHADGSMGGDYNFESEPLHRDSTASATLNVIPKVANSQYFYFRYQPDQVEVGEYYTLTAIITVSENATLRIGSRGADDKFAALEESVEANTAKTVEYVGYKNTTEPFSVRINNELDVDKVTISVKLVSVVYHDGTNLPDYHFHEVEPELNYEEIEKDTSSYDLEIKTNGETVANPSKWYYNQGEGSMVSGVNYNNGTITFDWETLAVSGNNQLRYRPNLDGSTKIKVEFSVTGNANAKVVLALCNATTFASSEWTEKQLTAGGSVDFSVPMTIGDDQLIFIQVQATGEAQANVSLTFSGIKISKEVEGSTPVDPTPDPDPEDVTYTLGNKSKNDVIAEPGVWAYNYSAAATSATYENGVINISFAEYTENTDLYLRLTPDLAAGTQFKIKFTIQTSEPMGIACFDSGDNSGWQSATISEANGTATIEGTYTCAADFMLQVRIKGTVTTALEITVTDIVITAA